MYPCLCVRKEAVRYTVWLAWADYCSLSGVIQWGDDLLEGGVSASLCNVCVSMQCKSMQQIQTCSRSEANTNRKKNCIVMYAHIPREPHSNTNTPTLSFQHKAGFHSMFSFFLLVGILCRGSGLQVAPAFDTFSLFVIRWWKSWLCVQYILCWDIVYKDGDFIFQDYW